jgi:hypothetical protein
MTAMRSTPGRVVAVVIGIPMLLAGIALGAFNLAGLFAHTSENHQVSYPWHGGTLSLDADNGNVTVRSSPQASAVSVSYTEHFGLKKPVVKGRTLDSGVQLSSRCPSWLLRSGCSINYTILVPAGAKLKLATRDGSVLLDGVDGSVVVNAGDGRVQASDLRSPAVDVKGGDGSVSLNWASAPETVQVSRGDGSVNLSLPANSGPYAVAKQMGDGHSDITVAQDPKASRSIVVHMGDGSLSIH